MISRLRRKWVLLSTAVALVGAAGCTALLSIAGPPPGTAGAGEAAAVGTPLAVTVVPLGAAASPVATTAPSGRQAVAVRRGPIAELLTLTGRVAGVEEVPVSFPAAARVATVAVSPGQVVEEGQELLRVDQREVLRALEAARARLETGSIRLAQAEAQAQARQREAERRQAVESAQRQQAVAEAEAALRRAEADYARTKAGAPASERQAAEGAVTAARAAVERAENELARLTKGPSESELKAADQQVWSTRLALQRAEAELERLRQGPDPAELRAAEREVATAQGALLRAQSELDRLQRGPDPVALSSAERDVQRAEIALRSAQATRSGTDKAARQAREAAILNAKLSLDEARERLARVRQGPPPLEVEAARRAVTDARLALQSAVERRDTVSRGPGELALAAANQAVEAARLAAANAEARYLELEAGPPAQQVADAQAALQAAQNSLTSAVTRQAEVNGRPTRAELRDAEDRLDAARAALERARADAENAAPSQEEGTDAAALDLVLLQKGVEQDRAAVESLERDLAATSLLAPIAGTVAAVQVRPGDPLEAGRPVITLARPGRPIVRAELSEREAARLASGQPATVHVEGGAGPDLEAAVDVVDGADTAIPSARLAVAWPETLPQLGATVQVTVTLQRKEDTLLVPQRAIRAAGPRRLVEVVDGGSRRLVDVQVGISSGGEAEILSGLSAGQLVTVGS